MVTSATLQNLIHDKQSRHQFGLKASEEVLKEPTLFYLMHAAQENTSKFRQAVCQAITVLLQNSDQIAKWQYSLER
jgi:pantoate kinase